ncbi:lysophospholipid acyltransferase family protein [Mycolicibacter sinensis]|uniref:Acyltransferase n=1 Tax=Mycolicibacter sinensis (strain JDM601) TaxID=875328 RepID=A0A1A2EH28_MYCSD|nr:lysophospholipid acyltransferase family protein [Mycolicibacter sinensis]OBG04863.1 acyltransferase [Mycolicibacter sinensis]OBG07175.1 acyltransferase [Mycolicibacter sinensis]
MAEPFFRTLEIVIPALVKANGPHVTFEGLENIPERGGAVLALNHTSYLDWYPASLAALRRRRRLRFMIKAEMTEVPVIRYVIKHIKLIPVDRSAGAGAYDVAVQRLREGELVGLHPEATISRSFELREFKTGAARMAHAAGVPIIPVIVWGMQRVWTKDHPKQLWRNHVPVLAKIGRPMAASGDVEATTAALRDTMAVMLDQAQREYPHPAGAYWVPRRLGGGAPTMAEGLAMRETELAERDRKRLERAQQGRLRRALAGLSRR